MLALPTHMSAAEARIAYGGLASCPRCHGGPQRYRQAAEHAMPWRGISDRSWARVLSNELMFVCTARLHARTTVVGHCAVHFVIVLSS